MRNGMENETRGNEGLRCRHCSRLCPARSTKSRELAKGRRTIVTAEFLPSNYRFVFLHRCDEHGRLVGQVRLRWQTSGETRWACLKRALFSQRPFHETSPSSPVRLQYLARPPDRCKLDACLRDEDDTGCMSPHFLPYLHCMAPQPYPMDQRPLKLSWSKPDEQLLRYEKPPGRRHRLV